MMLGMRPRLVALLSVLALGCGDDVSATGDDSSTSGSSGAEPSTGSVEPPTSSSTTGSTSTTQTSRSDESSSDGGFDPPEPQCGNGFVEADEECDDANDDNADGCTSQCLLQCGLDWTSISLPPTDTSNMDARGVVADGRGGATVASFLQEITTDQRGNETILDDEGVVTRVSGEGEVVWEVRLAQDDADVEVSGIAQDDAGNSYVAASVAVNGEDSDIRLYKLGPDGTELWSTTFDSAVDNAEDFAFGVVVDGSGAPVVSGQVRAGDGDDDVWVGGFDADNGDPTWSSTWSGQRSGSFSTDDGGPMAIGGDGTVYVFAREYVDFQTNVATLLAFDGMGGDAAIVFSTNFGTGGQNQVPADVAVEDDGSVLVAYTREQASSNEYYLLRLDPSDGSEVWSLDDSMVAAASTVRDAEGFAIVGADPLEGGGVAVMGTLVRSGDDAAWSETWVARFDDANALQCMFVRESPQLSLVRGSLLGRTVSVGAEGRAVVAALQIEDGADALWIGAFRPG